VSISLGLTAAFAMCVVLASIGTVLSACEHLAVARQFDANGFYAWPVLRTLHPRVVRSKLLDRFASVLLSTRGVVVTQLLEIAAAVAVSTLVLSGGRQRAAVVALIAILVGGHLLLHYRNHFGFDGSDQMRLLVWIPLGFFSVTESVSVQWVCIAFVAAQAILAYLAAGVAKMVSSIWRSGLAVGLILRTETYGSMTVSRVVDRYRLSKPLSWMTILFECAGPALVLIGPRGALAFIGIGLAFHLTIAYAMGLNTFVWSFAATYPAIVAVSIWSPLTTHIG
jgi:hypothetical protein